MLDSCGEVAAPVVVEEVRDLGEASAMEMQRRRLVRCGQGDFLLARGPGDLIGDTETGLPGMSVRTAFKVER